MWFIVSSPSPTTPQQQDSINQCNTTTTTTSPISNTPIMVQTKGSKALIKGAKVARKRALSAGGKEGPITKKVAASSPGGSCAKKKQARKRKSPSKDGPDTVSLSPPTDAISVPC